MLSDTLFYPPVSGQIRQAMIMLHGYGSNGNDLLSLAPALSQSLEDTIFYAPNAPEFISGDSYKWFDIDVLASVSLYERFTYIEDIMKKAKPMSAIVMDFIRYIQQKHSLTPASIILMGFSQGGLLSLLTGLCYKPTLQALIASSSMPIMMNSVLTINEVISRPAVLLTHGTADDVVPLIGMQMTQNTLKNLNCDVCVHTVNGMGHSIDASCIQAIIHFLENLR